MIDLIGAIVEVILEKGREIENEQEKEREREHVSVHVIDPKSVGVDDPKNEERMKTNYLKGDVLNEKFARKIQHIKNVLLVGKLENDERPGNGNGLNLEILNHDVKCTKKPDVYATS